MILQEEFLYKDEIYSLLLSEQENKLNSFLGREPYIRLHQISLQSNIMYSLNEYKLQLHSFFIQRGESSEKDNIAPAPEFLDYTGGIILATDFIESFGNADIFPCYCYQKVMELIFNEGTLITTIDHSKAMIRIRKNIIKGLRDIHNKKDNRCIRKFIKDSLVGNYTRTLKRKRIRTSISKMLHYIHK